LSANPNLRRKKSSCASVAQQTIRLKHRGERMWRDRQQCVIPWCSGLQTKWLAASFKG
jgi:hypothetical protein